MQLYFMQTFSSVNHLIISVPQLALSINQGLLKEQTYVCCFSNISVENPTYKKMIDLYLWLDQTI